MLCLHITNITWCCCCCRCHCYIYAALGSTPTKWRVTLSPWLTTIIDGANANALKSRAPALLGGLSTIPGPGVRVAFGNFSAGCSGVFWLQVSHATAACIFVVPSKCTVFIQKVLLVDWLGVTVTTVVLAAAPLLPLD